MKKNVEGGFGAAVLLVVASVVVVVGVVAYTQLRTAEPEVTLTPTPVLVVVSTPVSAPNAVPVITPVATLPAPVAYTGTVLAGTTSPLLDFTKADYDKALASGSLVVLYFYADWCPICQAEFPVMQAAFNQLSEPDVVGFRVNFNDSQTNNAEKALASEHGVAYQHTKVFVKGGQRILKSPETWERVRYIAEITNAAY
ncbi:MAG: thioredoxin family protein [Candidatus Andersenbacteria bacterium]|nr:thioredoxin family protein [Candidatus Andersenbacteria bacterium]